MKRVIQEPFIFLFASACVILLLFSRPSYNFLQVLSILMLISITFIISLKNKTEKPLFSRNSYYYLLFFSTLFVQLLVVATGGPSSHFLLLAFLFSLALSFFINLASSITFLFSFFIVLVTQVLLDAKLLVVITSDPISIVLFCLTFFIFGILTYYINRYYHIKDTLLDLLKKQILLQDIHEKSILSHIQELIIITDRNLRIISVNEAAERSLLLPKTDLLQKEIFDVLHLVEENNELLSKSSFSLQKILTDKETITLHRLSLVTKDTNHMAALALIAKPVLDLEGKVDQVIFIVQQEAQLSAPSENLMLDQVITKHKAMIEDVRRALIEKGMRDLAFKTEVIGKIDREIRHLIRLENNTVDPLKTKVNLATVCKSVCLAMQDFAHALHISIVFSLKNEEEEKKQISLTGQNTSYDENTNELFMAEVNLKWFDVLLHKLMEIAILLSSSRKDPEVVIELQKKKEKVIISLQSNYSALTQAEIPSLFSLNYGHLSTKTNLQLASGLEGMIAERISKKIEVPIQTEIRENGVTFVLTLDQLS